MVNVSDMVVFIANSLLQPPCFACTISTTSSGCNSVCAHAARGTTAPLRAIARPRPPGSMPRCPSRSAMVAAPNGSGSPFTRMVEAVEVSLTPIHLLGRLRACKPLDAERPDDVVQLAVQHQPGNGIGRHRG